MLPASIVRDVLEDRFGGACVLLWRDLWDSEIKERADIKPVPPPACFSFVEAVELVRPSMASTDWDLLRKSLPRNGGYDLLLECPICHGLRRALFGGAGLRSPQSSQKEHCTWEGHNGNCTELPYTKNSSHGHKPPRAIGLQSAAQSWRNPQTLSFAIHGRSLLRVQTVSYANSFT
jgi:hypothetical protein